VSLDLSLRNRKEQKTRFDEYISMQRSTDKNELISTWSSRMTKPKAMPFRIKSVAERTLGSLVCKSVEIFKRQGAVLVAPKLDRHD
jgi:hypothetical protein